MSHWAARGLGYINRTGWRKGTHVGDWHLSDVPVRPHNVRYRGGFGRSTDCVEGPLMTLKRHYTLVPTSCLSALSQPSDELTIAGFSDDDIVRMCRQELVRLSFADPSFDRQAFYRPPSESIVLHGCNHAREHDLSPLICGCRWLGWGE